VPRVLPQAVRQLGWFALVCAVAFLVSYLGVSVLALPTISSTSLTSLKAEMKRPFATRRRCCTWRWPVAVCSWAQLQQRTGRAARSAARARTSLRPSAWACQLQDHADRPQRVLVRQGQVSRAAERSRVRTDLDHLRLPRLAHPLHRSGHVARFRFGLAAAAPGRSMHTARPSPGSALEADLGIGPERCFGLTGHALWVGGCRESARWACP
jgi:hypothetical protein